MTLFETNSYCTREALARTVLTSTAIEGVHLRCAECNRLLAKANAAGRLAAEIKCTRCGAMNEI